LYTAFHPACRRAASKIIDVTVRSKIVYALQDIG